MSRVSEYAFVNAKLRARIGEMHLSSYLSDMIKASTLNEAIALLKDTDYSALVSVYSRTGDLQAVELALLEESIKNFKSIISLLKGKERNLITVLLEKEEIDNIKNAIRLWYSSSVRNHQISYRANYIYKKTIVHDVDYTALINSRDYEDVKKAFAKTIYSEVFDSYDIEKISRSGIFSLEISLDHLWFKRLFSALSELKGLDRNISETIYTVDVDLKNILLIVRYLLYHHLSADELKDVIIPYGHIYKEIESRNVLDRDDSLNQIRHIVESCYPKVYDDLKDLREDDDVTTRDETARHILLIEEYLSRARRKEFLKILTGRPFNIGIVLSYFFLYRDEMRTLRSIMSAKFYKWDESRIREAVL